MKVDSVSNDNNLQQQSMHKNIKATTATIKLALANMAKKVQSKANCQSQAQSREGSLLKK